MTEVPDGWEKTTFSELFDFKGGSQPPKSSFKYSPAPGYVRLLQIRDFESDTKAVYIKDGPHWPKCSEDDIMIGRYGASVGKILSGKAGAYNVALVRMVFDQTYFDARWVRWLLKSHHFQTPLSIISRSAQNGFNKADIADFRVPLPPFAEQRRIVTKLDALTARVARARAEVDRVATLAEKLREAILSTVCRETSLYGPVTVEDLSITSFDGPFGSNLKSADYTTDGVRVIRLENIGHLKFRGDKETFISEEKFFGLTRHRLIANDICFRRLSTKRFAYVAFRVAMD